MVAVVYLQNFSPKGIIKNDFINKVNIYDKIYELLNDYVYILNDKKIIITQQSIKDLITKLVNDNIDQSIIIHHKNGSANGRYTLYYYLTNIQ